VYSGRGLPGRYTAAESDGQQREIELIDESWQTNHGPR
jgi:hypothetical protein